jgi:hypothetical protein
MGLMSCSGKFLGNSLQQELDPSIAKIWHSSPGILCNRMSSIEHCYALPIGCDILLVKMFDKINAIQI